MLRHSDFAEGRNQVVISGVQPARPNRRAIAATMQGCMLKHGQNTMAANPKTLDF